MGLIGFPRFICGKGHLTTFFCIWLQLFFSSLCSTSRAIVSMSLVVGGMRSICISIIKPYCEYVFSCLEGLSPTAELEHRALWAMKQLNFNLRKAGDLRKLQIFELEELRKEAYENVMITKDRVNIFHEKYIIRKVFVPGQKVLLYNSRLPLFSEKLKLR